MILIITHKLDFTADYLINILNNRGIPYKRFNCEDILTIDCTITFDQNFNYKIFGHSDYHSVWFRRTMLPEISTGTSGEKRYLLNEIDNFLKNIFAVIDANWVSSPTAVYQAENKLYQLKMAQMLGFTIPETLVTTNQQELIDFHKLHKSIIIKPIAHTRIDDDDKVELLYTNRVTSAQINKISDYDLTPCIFQKEIEKEVELRITVVGNKVFSAQVNSQQYEETHTDWRRKKIEFTSFKLPEIIQMQCVKLVKILGLKFGAIDMILSPDGNFTFLEINPNGQWVWIESETGMKISEALIDELL